MIPDDQTNTVPTVPADDNGQATGVPVSQPQVPAQGIPVEPVTPVAPVEPVVPTDPTAPVADAPVAAAPDDAEAPTAGDIPQPEEGTV